MPGRDQTGPLGMGPANGRGMGYCGGNGRASFSGSCFGRRFGGSGFGYQNRGFRGGVQPVEYSPAISSAPFAEQDTNALKEELRRVEEVLTNIKGRIAASEKDGSESGG